MKTHREVAAILNIAAGTLYLLIAGAVFIFLLVVGGVVASQGEHQGGGIIGIVGIAIASFLAVLALPSIIGGWGLYVGKSWAKPVVIVLSILHLPNFPLGTALGVYSLWVLLQNEVQPQLPSASGPPII